MTLLVRNEEDILEANLDYHLAQGVDHVIVTDHGSTDTTPQILGEYERRGVISVLRDEGDEHHQSIRVTRMARLALEEHHADWLIHNDADEFWWPLAGSLRDVFSAIPPEYEQIVVQRRNFVARQDGTEPFYCRLTVRERESLNLIGQPLEPKVAHRANEAIVLPPGNHSVTGAELRPLPYPEVLEILHYPMRSYAQFERKVVQIGTGYERLPWRSLEVGRDQLKLLELQRAGRLREYYDRAVRNAVDVDRGLKDGGLVVDDRLATFMRSLPDSRPDLNRPDGRLMRAFLERSLHAQLDLERAQAARQTAENDAAIRIGRLQATEAVLRRELQEARSLSGAARTLAARLGTWPLLVRIPGLRSLWRRARGWWSRAHAA